MGIQMISAPRSETNEAGGPLPLPACFDRKASAAKWVRQGPAVDSAKEREYLIGTTLTADGWEVWRYPQDHPDSGKPCVVALASGPHILLHRAKAVQEAVNAIYGNVGKERLLAERRGETTGGVPTTDPGLLSDERIAKVTGVHEPLEEGDVQFNPIPNVDRGPQVTKPTVKLKSTRK